MYTLKIRKLTIHGQSKRTTTGCLCSSVPETHVLADSKFAVKFLKGKVSSGHVTWHE